MKDLSHLIEAVDFLCGIHRFVASSTGRIHGGSRNQRPLPGARLPRWVEEPNSSPPAGIPFIIATEPPGEEEPSGGPRAPQPRAHGTGPIVVVVVVVVINIMETTRSTSQRYSICALTVN